MPTLNPEDMIRVTLIKAAPMLNRQGEYVDNNSGMTIGWNSRTYKLELGREAIVPLEAAINAFGDPRSGPVVQAIPVGSPDSPDRLFLPDRESEVRRLRARYAISTGYDTGFNSFDDQFLGPVVKMQTLDGEDIVSVLDDPTGDSTTPVQHTVTQANDQAALIQNLQTQLDALKSQQGMAPSQDINSLPPDVETGQVTTIPSIPPIPQPGDITQPDDLTAPSADLPEDMTTDLPNEH